MKYFSELPKNFDSKISYDNPYDVFLKPPNFEGIFGSKSIFSLQTNNGIIWPFKELYESYLNDLYILKIYAKEILDAQPDISRTDNADEKEEKVLVLNIYLKTYNKDPFSNIGFLYLLFEKIQNPHSNQSFMILYLKK